MDAQRPLQHRSLREVHRFRFLVTRRKIEFYPTRDAESVVDSASKSFGTLIGGQISPLLLPQSSARLGGCDTQLLHRLIVLVSNRNADHDASCNPTKSLIEANTPFPKSISTLPTRRVIRRKKESYSLPGIVPLPGGETSSSAD
ncbi:hypothetical protein [Pseudomonas sp. RT6P73]